MLWFLLCVALLIMGYVVYGRVIEKIFGIRPKRATPAYTMTDGVDYVPMSKKKIWLIQLLNIAGTGPKVSVWLGLATAIVAFGAFMMFVRPKTINED